MWDTQPSCKELLLVVLTDRRQATMLQGSSHSLALAGRTEPVTSFRPHLPLAVNIQQELISLMRTQPELLRSAAVES